MSSKNPTHRKPIPNKRENVYSDKSSKKGLAGFLESLLRRFRIVSFLIALLPLYAISILAMGIAATPGVYLFNLVMDSTKDWYPIFHYMAGACTFMSGYFLYGMSIIFVIPFVNFILPFRIKAFRGSYFSLQSVPWYIHNALTYIVRYTFLEFITPSPLNTLFYRMMGMKIGKGVQINSTNISDPALIELDDYVTIGGSAHIIAHYAQNGFLVLSKVKIGKGATVGLKATIMGDTEIGPGAMIGPHEAILPKSRIPSKRRPPKVQPVNEESVGERSAV